MSARPADWEGPFPDPAERLLEFALGQLFRAAPARDLSAKIVAAWLRGERGSGLADLALATPAPPAPGAAGPHEVARRRPRPVASTASRPLLRLAAAAVLATGLGLLWWATRGPAAPHLERPRWEGAVALAHTPLEIVRAATAPPGPGAPDVSGVPDVPDVPGAPDATRGPDETGQAGRPGETAGPDAAERLRPGDVVLVPAGAPARLELPAGGELELAPRTVLGFDPETAPAAEPGAELRPALAALRLRLGGAVIRAGDPPAAARVLRTGFARVEWEPGAELAAEVDADDAVFGRGLEPLGADRALVLSNEPFSCLLTLEVRAGSATLLHDGERELLLPGARRVIASLPGRVDSVSEPDQARLADLLVSAMPDYDWFRPMRVPKPPVFGEAEVAMDELVALLGKRPERWDLVEVLSADARPGDWTGAPVPKRFVDLLALEGSPRAVAWARELWLEAPESFGIDPLLALADRGAFELVRELRARVQAFAGEATSDLTLAAAWLALRGDDAGREVLLAFLDRAWDQNDHSLTALLAAAALARLGDTERWRIERTRFADEIHRAVADEDLEEARRRAVQAELLLEELAREAPRLDYLDRRVDMRYFGGSRGLAEPEELLAFADRLEAD